MATITEFLPLSQLLFVLVSLVSRDVVGQSDVEVVATPSYVWTGHTDHLALNCSFHRVTSSFTALSFLVLSKTDTETTNVFKELAILPGSGVSVEVKDNLGGTVTGSFQPQGDSYIYFTWSVPGEQVKGKYRCEAHGVDATGHPVSSTAITVVDGKVADFDILVDMIQQVNRSLMDDLVSSENQCKNLLQNHTTMLNEQNQQISGQLAAISTLQVALYNLTSLTSHNGSSQTADIKTQFEHLKQGLLNRTYLETIRVNDLQQDLVRYISELDSQKLAISNQKAELDNIKSSLNGSGNDCCSNQTAQLNQLTSQVSSLQVSTDSKFSNQTLLLSQLQSQVNSNKNNIEIEKKRVDEQNVTIETNKQQIEQQNTLISNLNIQIANLTQKLRDQSAMFNNILNRLDDIYFRINQSRDAIFDSSFTYGGHTYYVSTPVWRNVPQAQSLCLLHGGHLVEIDDAAEMNALNQHLKTHQVNHRIVIAGNDVEKEGSYVFGRTGLSMSYFQWAAGFPSSSMLENCVVLGLQSGWQMENSRCRDEEWDRFVCEL